MGVVFATIALGMGVNLQGVNTFVYMPFMLLFLSVLNKFISPSISVMPWIDHGGFIWYVWKLIYYACK